MIGKLNHIAIAVPSVRESSKKYKNILGAKISKPKKLIEQGVTTIFVEIQNTKIELIEPLGHKSPLESFLSKKPDGGIHHICLEVKDIKSACASLVNKGIKILGSGKPSIGAHGKPVIFLHPKDFDGTLIELEES